MSDLKVMVNPGHDNDHRAMEKNHDHGHDNVYMSILINSALYFIDSVLLIEVKGKYHLLVIHNTTVLCNKVYSTIRGARIAFQHKFKIKLWRPDIIAEWSNFYESEVDWLDEKLRLINESVESLLKPTH